MNAFLGRVAAALVVGYQKFISPLMPPTCRFFPTCSEYSRVSFLRHGFLRGFWLTATRILRCNPWNQGGWDPVPPLPGEPEDQPEIYGHRKKEYS
jgi:hypothetical protein